MHTNNYIIAVDWGTSHLRAYLCKVNSDSTLTLSDKVTGLGVSKIETSFEQTLLDSIAPWVALHGKVPIIMIGQIGSSIGWEETEYIPCPATLKDIKPKCIQFSCEEHQVTIVPGLSCHLPNNNYDVMRGEELQVLGWLHQNPENFLGTHLICLPGTHTKWVLVKDGKIELFKTAMTGELFDLLTNHSILIQEEDKNFDLDSFHEGADFTLKSELGSFTHGLFSVRSKQLFNELNNSQAFSYLSGLLIGSDVRAAMNAEEWQLDNIGDVSIIGATHLSELFSQVLKSHHINTKKYKVSDMTLSGFNAFYKQSE